MPESVNRWDNSYPSGGNYWSDYTGFDLYSGPYQNETGSDGIGDTPYVIDADNQDNYPLEKLFPWDQHDIGITSLTTSRSICAEGYQVKISIMMFNYGENTEAFNLTCYANETIPIEMVSLELAGRTTVTVNFTWNTTGFAYGNYSVSAYASPVEDEILTEDNTLFDGWVFVTIPGDVTGDFEVNYLDLGRMIGNAYGKTPISPFWDPDCDINGDGRITYLDLGILLAHYGQHYP
jgi:hypothetical protein